jgi:LPXTG-site transpeptidase (sortase) family protein
MWRVVQTPVDIVTRAAVLVVLVAAFAGGVLPGTVKSQETAAIGVPVRLVIPSIGVDAPVASFGLNPDLTMPAPQEAGLTAWYTFSAAAGVPGNAVLAAHRDWQRQRGVFYALDAVRDGDEVWLQDGLDGWYLYRVVWSTSLPDDRAPVAAITAPTEHPAVTLITCSGTFSRTVGAYLERRVVRADLVGTYPPE